MSKTFISPKMRQQIEEVVGRVLLLLWYMTATYRHGSNLVYSLSQRGTAPAWLLDSVHSSLMLIFSGLAVLLTVMRKPAKAVGNGIEPRISAILGTFLMLSLPLLPQQDVNVELKVLSLIVTTAGLALSIYCLSWLGQSWGMMAAARNLVTKGPYSVVRHPLYASEMICMIGVAIRYCSLPALIIVLATIAFTVRRTFNEERVLRAAFPEYEEYGRRVPRLIPKPGYRRDAGVASVPAPDAARRP